MTSISFLSFSPEYYIKQDEAEQTCLILTEKEQKKAFQCPLPHQEEAYDISIIKGTQAEI